MQPMWSPHTTHMHSHFKIHLLKIYFFKQSHFQIIIQIKISKIPNLSFKIPFPKFPKFQI